MIIFVVYTVVVWLAVYWLRRRVGAYLVLAASCLPLFLLTAGASMHFNSTSFDVQGWVKSLGMFGGVLHIVSGGFLFIILVGGVMLAVQRRAGPHECGSCRYDLMGLVGDVCPECGSAITPRSDPDW